MADFVFAPCQMAMSLAFHIIFAAVGIGMPLLIAIAEGLRLRSHEPIYLDLARLSFEPRFMQYASGIFVVTVNAWMSAPMGFGLFEGRVTKIDPMATMLKRRSTSGSPTGRRRTRTIA